MVASMMTTPSIRAAIANGEYTGFASRIFTGGRIEPPTRRGSTGTDERGATGSTGPSVTVPNTTPSPRGLSFSNTGRSGSLVKPSGATVGNAFGSGGGE